LIRSRLLVLVRLMVYFYVLCFRNATIILLDKEEIWH